MGRNRLLKFDDRGKAIKVFPYKYLLSIIPDKSDRAFILLYWSGMSAADSYRYAYGKHDIKRASASTLGSHKLSERHIASAIGEITGLKAAYDALKFKGEEDGWLD